jgi:hypothetical protein
MSSTGRNLPGREVNALGSYDTPVDLCRAVVERLGRERVISAGTRILEPSCGSGSWIQALQAHQADRRREVGADWTVHLEALDVDPTVTGLDLVHAAGGTVTTCDRRNFDPMADAWARNELRAMGVQAHRHDAAAAGFLVTAPAGIPDLILGNPPYSVTAPRTPCPSCAGTGEVPRAGRRLDSAGRGRKCLDCDRWPAGRRPDGLPLGTQAELVIQVADLHIRRALELTRRHVVMVLRLPLLGGRDRFASLWALGHLREVWTVVGRPSFAHGATDSVESAVFWWDREWRPASSDDGPSFTGRWLSWGPS